MKHGKLLLAVVGLIAAILLVAHNALAQESSPALQALSQRLMGEINTGLQCSANLIDVQAKLAKETAEVTALKEKYEPAKPPAAEKK